MLACMAHFKIFSGYHRGITPSSRREILDAWLGHPSTTTTTKQVYLKVGALASTLASASSLLKSLAHASAGESSSSPHTGGDAGRLLAHRPARLRRLTSPVT